MANYTIIGGDGKEYGPVTDADVRQWIAEHRLAPNSQAKGETDTEFRDLAQFPEFAAAFKSPPTIAPLGGAASYAGPVEDDQSYLNRDYDLDIFGCISRGGELFKNHMGTLFVGFLVYLIIKFVVGALGNIPIIGLIFSLANMVCSGALMAGLYYLFIRVNRGEPADLGDLFAGFGRSFGHLFLVTLIQGLAILLCMLPFIVVLIIKLLPLMDSLKSLHAGTPPDAETIAGLKSFLFTNLPILLVILFICGIPATYLSVSWIFSLPLVLDKQMEFGQALKTSWKMVNKHWWLVFGLLVAVSLLNLLGLLLCCIGMLFTIPIGIAATMIAYETIFGRQEKE
jgi:uncharacterized membrane protein